MPTRRNLGSERGQALIMTTMALVSMFGLLGLAVDVGWMHFRHEAAQTAADAAALAAAEVATASGGSIACNSGNVGCQSATACPNPVPSNPTNNLQIACAYASSNGFTVTTGGRQNVTVAAGAGTAPPSAPGVTATYWVTVQVTETIPQFFSAVLGHTLGTVSAQATSAATGSVSNSCLYILNPTMAKAFVASGGTSVTATCGIFVDSTNADALDVSGGSTVTASVVKVAGNYSSKGGSTISPLPTTGAAATADPFVSVAAPSYSGCDYTNKSVGNGLTVTLTPGVYCNGITLNGGAHVTFQSGTYILNGGGLSITNGATVTGAGVTFFNTANGYTYAPLNISGGAVVTLSAPTSGSLEGLLFYQDRAISSALVNTVTGGASEQLTGTLYFPTTTLSYSGGSATTITAIVANSVTFSGGSHLAYDPTGIHTGLGSMEANLIE